MNTPTITIALATFNEEANIEKFLQSHFWANEIIIVDGQSQDNTQKIIKSFQKKYHQIKLIVTANKPMFHLNKQIAIDASSSNWILQLDADEIVSPELKTEILKTIAATDLDGFWLKRSNFFLGRFLKKGGQYPDKTLRLYRCGTGHLPCLSVHEQAVVKGRVGELTADLLHFADADFHRYLLRNHRYTSLMADDMIKNHLPLNFLTFLNYFFLKPEITFFQIYFRHLGFLDGLPGLIFAYYSAISHRTAFSKYYGQKTQNRY